MKWHEDEDDLSYNRISASSCMNEPEFGSNLVVVLYLQESVLDNCLGNTNLLYVDEGGLLN